MSAGSMRGRGKTTAEGKAAARAAGKAKAAAACARLDAAVQELAASDEAWSEYLRLSGAMHGYSWGNRLLIMLQRPDTAMVAGFHRWRELGRPVVKGAKGVQILAPMVGKREEERADGTVETRVFTRGFRVTYVFAVEDTDGPRVGRPVPIAADDDGDDARAVRDRMLATCALLGVDVTLVDSLEGSAGGFYTLESGEVTVRTDRAAAQVAKTLAHELAHALEHRAGALVDRVDAEMIAEAAAFCVMAQYGVDTASYSAPYVAAWSDDPKRFRVVLERVAAVSAEILAVSDHAGSCAACGWTGEGSGGCERCR